MSLYLKCISCTEHIVVSCFINFDNQQLKIHCLMYLLISLDLRVFFCFLFVTSMFCSSISLCIILLFEVFLGIHFNIHLGF